MQDANITENMKSHVDESFKKLLEQLKTDLSMYNFIPMLALAFYNDNFVFTKENGVRNDDFLLSNYIADLYLSFQNSTALPFPDEGTAKKIVKNINEIYSTCMLKDMLDSQGIESNAQNAKGMFKYTERSFFVPVFLMIYSVVTEKEYLDFFYEKSGFHLSNLQIFNSILKMMTLQRYERHFPLNEVLAFSIDDIMEVMKKEKPEFQISVSEIQKLIDYFLLEKSNNRDCIPRYENPVTKKPIFRYGDKYICSDPLRLIKRMPEILESELVTDRNLWDKYTGSRGKALENATVSLLKKVFKNAAVYQNIIFYPEDGKRHETDILIDTGAYLFIVEAKSGRFQEQAKLGNEKIFGISVDKLLQKAHEQCLFAYDYIQKNGKAVFENDEKKVEIENEKYIKIYMLTVTLENLDKLTSDIYKTVPVHEENPILSFSIYDLFIITDILPTGSELLLYLDCRQKIVKKGIVNSSTELDTLSNFLVMGLQFENIPDVKDANIIDITNYSDDIEKYYFGEIRKKPTLSRGVGMNILLLKLYQAESCYADVVGKELLSLKLKRQKDFVNKFDCITKLAIRGGRHDFSFLVENSTIGVSFFCYSSNKIFDDEKLWKDFAYMHMQKQNTKFWFYVIATAKPSKINLIGYV